MPNGYRGKILRVNLTERRTEIEEQNDAFYRRYLGGIGLVTYYLLKEMKPGVDALSPDNVFVFAAGPVTGAPIGGSGRNGVGAKSPLGGALGTSEAGGHFGAELKRAGFDAIVVEGKADKPVYLWVTENNVEIKDASHLWGLTTGQAQAQLRLDHGDRFVRTSLIGPGGENMVRFASVTNDLFATHGRTGMGAVLGSKNLKGVAVRAKTPVPLANPDKIKDMAKWMASNKQMYTSLSTYGTGAGMRGFNLIGNLPTRNFRDGDFPQVDAISGETIKATINIGMDGCFACPIRCKKVVKVEGNYLAEPEYGGPEYETLAAFGSNCGVDNLQAIAQAHSMCNGNSLDTISAGATIAFAMECFENGILTKDDCDGLDLSWGNGDSMLALLDQIIRREGIGNLLAEGTRRAAQQLGRGAEQFAMECRGVEFGMHEPRVKPALGVGYTVANHGGDHNLGIHDTFFEKEATIAPHKAIGVYDVMDHYELTPRKMAAFGYGKIWRILNNHLVMCVFLPWSYQQVVEIVSACTGWDTNVFELMQTGQRAINLGRVFNLREGVGMEEDKLPERFFSPPTAGQIAADGQALDHDSFRKAQQSYYRLLGWDAETGVPTYDKLAELGVSWAAEQAGIQP
ncbi:MAG: aldehyde ferredoxin oxidoreductase family protein [Chloroflexota bacterium]